MNIRASGAIAFARRFGAARAGTIVTVFALTAPVVSLAAVAAVQLYAVYSVQSASQDVADAAATFGAGQLFVASSGVLSRTQQFANSQLYTMGSQASFAVTATQVDTSTVTVAIDGTMPSFFGNMLPAGGFKIHATATAVGSNQGQLCVLILAPSTSSNLHLSGSSQMQSTCEVHSNTSIVVDSGASLTAVGIEAATSASGTMTPTANTGAPSISDPFSSLNTTAPSTCAVSLASVNITSSTTLSPGTYCYGINLSGNATLTLSGGNYVFGGAVNVGGSSKLVLNSGQFYFSGSLVASGSGSITGTDAVLDFFQGPLGGAPSMSLSGSAAVSLSGRTTGTLAGFVIIVDKSVTGSFTVQSDYISKLTGTTYSPAAALQVQGTAKAIQASDWTVIAANSLQMTGSPDLVINANYSKSVVPVPFGVGDNRGSSIKLSQ